MGLTAVKPEDKTGYSHSARHFNLGLLNFFKKEKIRQTDVAVRVGEPFAECPAWRHVGREGARAKMWENAARRVVFI